jgi:Ca2+-binding RTX toxin-like protein
LRKAVLLLASMALAVLLAGGIALAAEITCPNRSDDRCMGTTEDDTMTGTDERDKMRGFAGNDTLYGKGFRDFLVGHAGNDTLRGQEGDDALVGARQTLDYLATDSDRLFGGQDQDILIGGSGNDRVFGGPGNDTVQGEVFGNADHHSNRDFTHGDDDDDTIHGDDGELYGDAGEDTIVARGADALLDGGPGNDKVRPAPCDDDSVTEAMSQEAIGGSGEDFLGTFSELCEDSSVPRTITIRAVDGEHDTIACHEALREIVRADRLDTFHESPPKMGREHCESVTRVE